MTKEREHIDALTNSHEPSLKAHDKRLRELVELEGVDAAAEERIVAAIAEENNGDYFSTDTVRIRIRKLQNRFRRQRVPGGEKEHLNLG